MEEIMDFTTTALKGKNLRDLKTLAKSNEREFRQLARAEFKNINRRIRRIENTGINSPAVMNIKQKLGENLFTISNKNTTEILALLDMSRNFTNAKTSTIKGTKQFAKKHTRKAKRINARVKAKAKEEANKAKAIKQEQLPTNEPVDNEGIEEPPYYDFGDAELTEDDIGQWNTYTAVMQALFKKHPRFYNELEQASKIYENLAREVEDTINFWSSYIDIDEIADAIYDEFGARVGQILSKNFENYDTFRGFKES